MRGSCLEEMTREGTALQQARIVISWKRMASAAWSPLKADASPIAGS